MCFLISKYDGNLLKLEHFDKDIFVVDWGSESGDKVKVDSFPREKIADIITWFSEGSYSRLESILELQRGTFDELEKNFEENHANYTYNLRGFELFTACGGFSWLYVFLFFMIWMGTDFTAMLFISMVPAAVGMMSIELYGNYASLAKRMRLFIDGKDIRVEIGKDKWQFNKSDLMKMTIVTGKLDTFRNPFSPYEYIRLNLKNGEVINIPFMVIPLAKLRSKLRGIEVKVERQFYPRIKN